jgi:hypothetical protein
MTAIGSLLAVLAGLLRDLGHLTLNVVQFILNLGHLTLSPSAPSALTALAATVLAGAMLTVLVALLTSVGGLSRTAASLPLTRRARALQEKSWRAAFLRQRDPDAAGRARPRAPSAALVAAPAR